MGQIISATLTKEDKVLLKIRISYEESLILKGHTKNIRVFSDNNAEIQSNISKRGARESTKYLLIPKKLRENLNFEGEVKCQKIESKKSTLFVFKIDKDKIKGDNEKATNSK